MLFPLLFFLAQDPARPSLSTVVTHQPVEVMKAVTGTALPRVGLYELLTCNNTDKPLQVPEGRMLSAMATKVAPMAAAALPAFLDRSKRATWKYRLLRGAEYASLGLGLWSSKLTPAQVTSASQKLGFFGLLASGASGKAADSMKAQEALGLQATATLAKPDVVTPIMSRGCVSRLAFGEYRGQNVKTFEVFWEP